MANLKIYLCYVICIAAFPEYMSMYHVSAILLQAKRKCWLFQNRRYSGEPLGKCLEWNPGSLDEQPVLLLTLELSLRDSPSHGLLSLGNLCVLYISIDNVTTMCYQCMQYNVVLKFTYNAAQLKTVTSIYQPLAVISGLQKIQVIEKLMNRC